MMLKTPALILIGLYLLYPVASFIFMNKLRQKIALGNSRMLALFGIFILLNGVFIALLGIYSYGILSFGVLPLCLVSPIVGLVAVDRLKKTSVATNSAVRPTNLINVILVGTFLFSPLLSRAISSLCDSYTRFQAKIIISGVEAYKVEHGFYPQNFIDIFTEYVEEWPSATCLKPYKLFDPGNRDYKLELCDDGSPRLTVSSTDLFWMQIYTFSYHQWTQYDASEYCDCYCRSSY